MEQESEEERMEERRKGMGESERKDKRREPGG